MSTHSAGGGMKTFLWIWFGQLVSMLGTGMTRFALMIWAYQQTRSATTLALLGFFSYLPFILISPFAGVLVDRLNRKMVMLFSDLFAALQTVLLLSLYLTGGLQIWHLYLVEGLTGAMEAFQMPAYAASISLLVNKDQYSRANGLMSLAANGSRVFAPLLAGLVLTLLGLPGVMTVDLLTFTVALVTLLAARIPNPPRQTGMEARANWRSELFFGARFIFKHPGLRGLMLVFLAINLMAALTYYSILPAMILARSGSRQMVLSSVQSALGIGGVVGGLAVSAWPGPKNRARGVLVSLALSFLMGDLLLGSGQSPAAWIAAAFLAAFFIPFIVSWAQAIWQSQVPLEMQGRVFSSKDMLQTAVMPVGFLLGGLLADRLFEPAMQVGGVLEPLFSPLVGSGPGAGMGVMFLFTGTFGCLLSLSGFLSPALRNLENDPMKNRTAPESAPGD